MIAPQISGAPSVRDFCQTPSGLPVLPSIVWPLPMYSPVWVCCQLAGSLPSPFSQSKQIWQPGVAFLESIQMWLARALAVVDPQACLRYDRILITHSTAPLRGPR